VAGLHSHSDYEGLHVIDRQRRADLHVPNDLLGCRGQYDLAWSADGARLAYACASRMLYVINADGSNAISFATGLAGRHSSPSWAPDGRRLVFAVRHPDGTSSIYITTVGGASVRLLAKHATAPAWSPDGSRIAYRAGCGGIKLITPLGADVTSANASFRCRAFAVPGLPAWSPDGNWLAISAPPRRGLYVASADGKKLRQVSPDPGTGLFGRGRAAWKPVPRRTPARSGTDTDV
jgi:dipeptidyl aminopeptidase/acylaminoacyl peptidase